MRPHMRTLIFFVVDHPGAGGIGVSRWLLWGGGCWWGGGLGLVFFVWCFWGGGGSLCVGV